MVNTWTMRDRITAVLQGRTPDCPPFIDRMEIWYENRRLAECGLDVCESFSPDPLTECTFEEAWQAWQDGPII